MPTNDHYAAALRDLTEKRPVPGLFARCFAEEHGDETRTKARYIELRAIEIEQEETARRRDAAPPVSKLSPQERRKFMEQFHLRYRNFGSMRKEVYHALFNRFCEGQSVDSEVATEIASQQRKDSIVLVFCLALIAIIILVLLRS